jgi:hypothetical protein
LQKTRVGPVSSVLGNDKAPRNAASLILRDIKSMKKGKRNLFGINASIIRLPVVIMPARTAAADSPRSHRDPAHAGKGAGIRALIAVILLPALLPVPGAFAQRAYPSQSPYGKTNPFVESMQLMLDAMKNASRSGETGSWGNAPLDWSQYNPSWAWPGSMGSGFPSPWGGGQLPGQQQMQQMMPGLGSTQGQPFSGSSLNGVWRGRSGDVLVIQGNRFRIYADKTRFTEGELRIQGNQLWLHNPKANHTQRYEYAEHEGRLALRDARGQLLLYRRADAQGW